MLLERFDTLAIDLGLVDQDTGEIECGAMRPPPYVVPQLGTDQGLGTLEIALLDLDADSYHRLLAVDGQGGQDFAVAHHASTAIDAQRFAHARHEQQYPDSACLDDVAQAVGATI